MSGSAVKIITSLIEHFDISDNCSKEAPDESIDNFVPTETMGTKETKQQMICDVTCICGNYFTKVDTDVWQFDEDKDIICALCKETSLIFDEVFFHCSTNSKTTHSSEYHICYKCSGKQQCYKNVCEPMNRFLQSMQYYQKHNDQMLLESSFFENIETLLNDYIHLLHRHNDDDHFSTIFNSLGDCNIDNCMMFKRNYRNRNDEQQANLRINNSIVTQDIVYCQILDKMHCCFYHCYDIGNRLTSNDIKMINNEKIKSAGKNELMSISQINLLGEKHKKCCTKYNEINPVLNTKYNQLLLVENEKKEDTDTDVLFGFGYEFSYADNIDFHNGCVSRDDPKEIVPKYCHLKQEITENDIALITMVQFLSEYSKAKLHFNSYICKNTYRPYINIEHLLSVMIYCNYTEFQSKFSKSYRENKGMDHQNFYYLGYHLKYLIHTMGTEIQKVQSTDFIMELVNS
eukprot:444985_1